MTVRSERLQVVLELEERKEQQALDRMNEVRRQWQAEQDRLAELQSYQQEYHQQMRQQQQGTVPVSRLQGWQSFIARLDLLIGEQQARASQAEQRVEQARQQWQQAWERRRGMERYIDTCRVQEQRARDLAEQKQADEAAARQFSRRR
ncbi:flagellar export protein FliJ [Marinobacter bryozoorum]|uniref:flagellar export protein FliJ n=1 Tax=Marinobacter bryozoorum TaxID=256324 RepID=UPI002004AD23|nr:flagellar export protein FliJ [Marinobacter bryozoorum]MCK7543453.1 flagellar export protein FliJ [Marinobacter bryozoorum]